MNLNFLRGPGNLSAELIRMGGAGAFILYPLPYLYVAFHNHVMPDASFGTGYALVITAIGGACFLKDTGVAKANATGAGNAS